MDENNTPVDGEEVVAPEMPAMEDESTEAEAPAATEETGEEAA